VRSVSRSPEAESEASLVWDARGNWRPARNSGF